MNPPTERLPRFRVIALTPSSWAVLDAETGHRTPAPSLGAAERAADIANAADALQRARQHAGRVRLLNDVFDRR